jgi:hypothetical protein
LSFGIFFIIASIYFKEEGWIYKEELATKAIRHKVNFKN